MPNTKEVTPEQFYESLTKYNDETYHLALKGWQVAILHGLVALAADHPGIKKMHEPTQSVITDFREWCKRIFAEWGFTPEEVEYLDKMRGEI